jgi:serine/threonine protein kinase
MDRSIGDMPTLPGENEGSCKGILQPETLFGRYKVLRFLGRGGMGEVYEVEHELDGAHYAMKVLSSEVPQTPENIRRFEREAQVMARLQHPNVISVDYFDETDGKYWFRMELAQGIEDGVVTLGDLAARNGGRIGQGLLVCLFEQILDGLSCAHEKGVIHRDLKPSNILLGHADELTGGIVPKISDFGLVRLVGQDWLLNKTLVSTQQSLGEKATEGTDDSQGLSTQSLVGTYAYMSPEQKQRKKIDERSDIYAVGLMIYRLLTGYTNPGEKIRKKDSRLHAFWQRVVDQSVREDPEDRFASAAAMIAELQRGHKVLASLDGKASLKKSKVEFEARRCYTANRYLEEASMIFPNDPEVREFRTVMREKLGILQELRTSMQNFRRLKMYDDALRISRQFSTICIEDESINKFIAEYPQLVSREQSRQFIVEASRQLEAEDFEAASQAAKKALLLEPENVRVKQIHDHALAMLKKRQMLQTREQVSKGLQKTHSLLKQKRYARALDTLRHTPCSDSTHPAVIALRNACQSGLKKIRRYWEKAEEARKSADYQGAISILKMVLESVAPEDPGTIERLNRLGAEVKELSSASAETDHAWKNKSYRKCLVAADRILALQPQNPKVKERREACAKKIGIIQQYIDKAEEHYLNQQYDKAIKTLEKTKRYYRLERRTSKDDAALETRHKIYSPEYKDIMDKIAVIAKAKTSTEQALKRAREAVESRDLVEARLALNEYFELQTEGKEGLLLERELENLHRRVIALRRLRRSVIYLAVAAIVGLCLAYGLASLIMTHRMEDDLEESLARLSFGNLMMMQSEAGQKMSELRQPWFCPLFSIDDRWKQWEGSLVESRSAYELYASGDYEEGQIEFDNLPITEFTPFIQSAFDKFVEKVDKRYADVNEQLLGGDYSRCIENCNAFLLEHPRHSHFINLLQKAKDGQELEKSISDPNIELTDLSRNLNALGEISPQHDKKLELEEQCIKRLESEYDLLNRSLSTDANDIEKELTICHRALEEEIILFENCHGYELLRKRLTDRVKDLEGAIDNLDVLASLAEAKLSMDRNCWMEAKEKLDRITEEHREVSQAKDSVEEKIKMLRELVNTALEQAEQQDWFAARDTMKQLWSIWSEGDKSDLLREATELQDRIKESIQKESEDIIAFAEAMDQKDHEQISNFVQDHMDGTSDLTPIYLKWIPRLMREIDVALKRNKINTALDHLSHVLDHDNIKNDVLDKDLERLLQYKADADQKSRQAKKSKDEARFLKNTQYAKAWWQFHLALEINCECDGAEDLRRTLMSKERLVVQKWREAKSFYDDKYYVHAHRTLAPIARDFPSDVRLLALSHEIDTKTKAAEKAAEDVKNRRLRVKDFYDKYHDYEFAPDVDPRVKKEYEDLVDKYHPSTEAPPSKTEDLSDPNWCQIRFSKAPDGVDVKIQIEGHGLKALGPVFVRSEDRISIMVSNKDCSRTQAISIEPWKKYRIDMKRDCLDRREAEVKVVKKGLIFKDYDFDAMADQIIKAYRIDKERAIKSIKAELDRNKNKKEITTLQVPLIDWWVNEKPMEPHIE